MFYHAWWLVEHTRKLLIIGHSLPITRGQNFRQVQSETNCRRHFKVHLK